MNTGRNASIGPVVVTPSSEARWPSWNTNVITPSAAPIESTFMNAALTGITSERKTIASSSSDSPTTTAMNSGSFEASTLDRSEVVAVAPPIDAFTPVAFSTGGTTLSRRVVSRSVVAWAWGFVAGKTAIVAVSFAGLRFAGATAATFLVPAIDFVSVCSAALSPGLGSSATTSSGPLKPGPKPSDSWS